MSEEEEAKVAQRAAMKAAREDLKRGDPEAAQKHLDIAVQYGAQHSQTNPVAKAIESARQTRLRQGARGGKRGFWVALLCYLLISLQQPRGWGMPLWIFLAFLLAPGFVGLVVGQQQKILAAPGHSFWSAFKSAFWVTAFYTIIHLILLGGSHSAAANKGQEGIAVVIATLTYALVSGLVAGATSAMIVSTRVKERQV